VIIRQSLLASWARCPAAAGFERAGFPRRITSAIAYGTVMHHALLVFERLLAEDRPAAEALAEATEAFSYYWSPANIHGVGEPVSPDGWLPRHSYADLRTRGIETLNQYAAGMRGRPRTLLACEYRFRVPVDGTWDDAAGEPHVLFGTLDRLQLETHQGRPVVAVGDYKTGVQPSYLRHHLQFTAYCYATTRPEFWTGWRGEEGFGAEYGATMYKRFAPHARRGTWINLQRFTEADAGFRGDADYARLRTAISQVAASIAADIYPLNLVGEVCQTCSYTAVCGGTGLPDDDSGRPLAGRIAK
jgi:hypothetical protein